MVTVNYKDIMNLGFPKTHSSFNNKTGKNTIS